MIMLVVYVWQKCWHRMPASVRKVYYSLKSKLMFSSLLRSSLQAYYGICLNALYGLRAGNSRGTWNLITSIVATAGLLGFLVFTVVFMRKHKDDIGKKEFKASYGTLYQNVETYKKPAGLNFAAYFCARRLIYAFAIVFLDQMLVN